jgi:hypothetical protein
MEISGGLIFFREVRTRKPDTKILIMIEEGLGPLEIFKPETITPQELTLSLVPVDESFRDPAQECIGVFRKNDSTNSIVIIGYGGAKIRMECQE